MTDTEILDKLMELLDPLMVDLTIDQDRENLDDTDTHHIDSSYICDIYRWTSCAGVNFPGLEVLLLLQNRNK